MPAIYRLDRTTVQLIVRDPIMLQSLRSGLWQLGCRDMRWSRHPRDPAAVLAEEPADLIVAEIADDAEAERFAHLCARLRHGDIGSNPFVPVVAAVIQPSARTVHGLVDGGVDDILPFPWEPMRLEQRIDLLVRARRPFVVTSDYVGPDRRRTPRADGGHVAPIAVPNPLHAKAVAQTDDAEFAEAIAAAARNLAEDRVLRLCELIVRLIDEFTRDGAGRLAPTCLKRLSHACATVEAKAGGTRHAGAAQTCRSIRTCAEAWQGMAPADPAAMARLRAGARRLATEIGLGWDRTIAAGRPAPPDA